MVARTTLMQSARIIGGRAEGLSPPRNETKIMSAALPTSAIEA